MKFNNLLRESQFHGGRRLAEKKFRWFWCISVTFLFTSATMILISTLERFVSNPTYLVQVENVEDLIDFPTVLVCPEIAFTRKNIDNFFSNVYIPPGLNYSYLKSSIQELTAFFSLDVPLKEDVLADIERLLTYNNMDIDTAGRMLTTSCEDTFDKCRWEGYDLNCTTIFKMEMTGDGYCCVFNGNSLKNYRIRNTKPQLRIGSLGFSSGLTFAVKRGQRPVDINIAYKWLALDFGGHFVEATFNGTALSPGVETWAKYSIKRYQINENALNWGESLTKCRMNDYPLKYFPVYLRKYCNIECEMQRTLDICGCVTMVHPKPDGVKICNSKQLQCSRQVKVADDSPDCGCPIQCNFVQNIVGISSFALMQDSHPIDRFYHGLDFNRTCIVRVFVSDHNVKTNSQWSYYSEFMLYSQLGGTFNVFVGCSVLTILELIILAIHGLKDGYAILKSKRNKVVQK